MSGLATGIDGAAHAASVADQRPTVAFIGGVTGAFFDRPTARSLAAVLQTFNPHGYSSAAIRASAQTFSKERFQKRMCEFLASHRTPRS